MNHLYSHPTLKLLLLLLACGLFIPLSAQNTKVVSDLGLWTGVEVEKEVKDDWTFSLKQELRLKTNMSEVNNYFTQAGIRYKINRNFALEAKYRFTRNKKTDLSYENRSRYSLDLRYKGRLDFLTFDYRLRYQKEVESMRLFDMKEPYEKYVRNRITVRYTDFKKIEPYLSGELFQLFQQYEFPRFDYMRLEAGVRIETGDLGEFKLAWGFNREFQEVNPATLYVMRVNYTFKL
ncbi:MAG: DUF2490 domain-containing protein [Bacteroidales bacterium]